MADCVRMERDGFVVLLTIDRPKALNALNEQVLSELGEAVEEVASSDARAVIVTGAGDKSFVAGADIVQMSSMGTAKALAYAEKGHALLERLEAMPQPVIAAVNGFAVGGGCELALACDLIYASENARFGQPEVKLGLMPGFGGAVRLPRKVGAIAASEWILTGDVYSAARAKEIGLVCDVLSPDQLLPHCRSVAETIASRSPKAVAASKRLLTEGMALGPGEAAALERKCFSELFETEDMREGTAAFVEKREASFKGA